MTSRKGRHLLGSALETDIPGSPPRCDAEKVDQPGLFKTILESTPVAHSILLGNHFSYANPAFEQLTGYTQSELL